MECISMTVQVRNCEFDVDVYAKVSSGGSASWGSDEPPWFDVDIFDIYNPVRNRSVIEMHSMLFVLMPEL